MHNARRPLVMVWHNPANGRWYKARLAYDLLDDLVIQTEWQGPQRGGNRHTTVVGNYAEAFRHLRRLHQRRQQRGYRLISIRRADTWGVAPNPKVFIAQ